MNLHLFLSILRLQLKMLLIGVHLLWRSTQSLVRVVVFISILMAISIVRCLILVIQPAQNMINRQIAVLGLMIRLQVVAQVHTVKLPNPCVLMHIAMVCRVSRHGHIYADGVIAFDDQTSTFIIPAGAGFEVIFCPGGRSTNILATSKSQLTQLAQSGTISTRLRSRDGLSFFVTYDEVSQTMGLPIRSKAIEITSNSTRLVVRTAFSMLLLASIIWVGL